jgi:hypothetical protein
MAHRDIHSAPGPRPSRKHFPNQGIVVPVLEDDENVDETECDEETASVTSSSDTDDSSVVSMTNSDASVGESDFSVAWIEAIEAASDSEDNLRRLLLQLRTQRNHFPPSSPPMLSPPEADDTRRQPRLNRRQGDAAINTRNAFQALASSDADSDSDHETHEVGAAVAVTGASVSVQCRYLKVMIKVNFSDLDRKKAQGLFEQKCWLDAADLFESAHRQLHLLNVWRFFEDYSCHSIFI